MLNQVTGYTIIENSDETLLTDQVTKRMQDGWVPSGPLVIKDNALLQVMVTFAA
jgi:hypothetical protein